MEQASWKRFPANPENYKLYEEVGEGVSATVYRALCIPFNEIVAIKVLDLEKCNNDLDGIRREVQTMSLIDHPNLLRAYCSFTTDRSLWVVMPYMAGGSCLHIMKSSHPEGFEEPVIATLLREVLRAIVYLHRHGHIHRDVKAGNILVDVNGAVKLADFGVSACMFDTGDRQRSRNTFVGTPCWMAPEVMQQLHGYDFKADIWSFGITSLELAHGHAPFSKYPPMKVLLMTLQNAPPGLDYERDRRFSKSFKDLVATCLVKDPKKRPTSEKLLKHSFFKRARSNEYLAKNLLDGLSPLGDRFRQIKAKEADLLQQNKELYEEHLSQQKYIKGISGWNFNIEDLKREAALLDDTVGVSTTEEIVTNNNGFNNGSSSPDIPLSQATYHANCVDIREGEIHEVQSFEGSFAASFSSQPLKALKGYFDVYEDDTSTSSPDCNGAQNFNSEHMTTQQQSSCGDDSNSGSTKNASILRRNDVPQQHKTFSGSLITEHAHSPSKSVFDDTIRSTEQPNYKLKRNYSGPLTHHQMRDTHESFANPPEEISEGRVIQRKGRFKITSKDTISKGLPSTNCSANSLSEASSNSTACALPALPSLQFLVHQNAIEKETLSKLVRCVEHTSCRQTDSVNLHTGELSQHSPLFDIEKELKPFEAQLQQSITCLVEEIEKLNVQNAQLQQQIDTLSSKGEKDGP